ncbi:unnamed protein product [Staurois parvus]|uniref:Uncharacterized protein n=1 Tax=Staurois parvus TaxID=386267 RepID=A0ABN9DBB7_9NEOB|nr:unnamed protein product [Staurois parvus]
MCLSDDGGSRWSLRTALSFTIKSPLTRHFCVLFIYLMMVGDGVTFLCGIPGIQRTGTSLWWVPITGPICQMMVRDGVTFLCGIPGIQRTGTSLW